MFKIDVYQFVTGPRPGLVSTWDFATQPRWKVTLNALIKLGLGQHGVAHRFLAWFIHAKQTLLVQVLPLLQEIWIEFKQ